MNSASVFGSARAFPSGPQILTGRDAVLEIASLGVTLPLAELYRGVLNRQ